MPLQRSFRGLSDQVGRYEGGQVTLELDPFVQLIQDSFDFVNPYDWVSRSVILTAEGQSAVMDAVPEGEMHRIRYLGVNATSDGPFLMTPIVSDRVGIFYGLTGAPSSFATTTVGQTLMEGMWLDAPGILLYPTQQVGWNVKDYVPPGNGDNVTCDITVLRQVIKI